MAPLATNLRRDLERAIVEARKAAERGARSALNALTVGDAKAGNHLDGAGKVLRNRLRAHARQLGDPRNAKTGEQAIDRLVRECAYEHWHRMLFARFLAENDLLIEPESGVSVGLEDVEELARDQGVKPWPLAASYAQRMLPQIFRADDPVLAIDLPTEAVLKLESLLEGLPSAVFTADDSLGWTYQFWQTAEKDAVNASGVKIGADELPAVTQLFTEPYMVRFLIHNTLGAWWAGKKLTAESAASAEREDELRRVIALPGIDWEYLRFVRQPADAGSDDRREEDPDQANGTPWRPAAGTFPGWPRRAADLRVLDPCCGSGHFLVELLHHLVPIRMAEEALDLPAAVEAVLRDNLHGLEIDERCCQIAAFALALAAWKMIGSAAPLPELHIACSGIGPQSTADDWLKLASRSDVPMPPGGREPIRRGLIHMHELFSQAPTLGSLIDPTQLPAEGFAADFETLQPYIEAIMEKESRSGDDEARERAVAAAGMVKAAELLAREYTLVITNVPYLGRGKQSDTLKKHLEAHYKTAKADLATAFVMRALMSCASSSTSGGGGVSGGGGGGTTALVTPQNWLFLTTYKKLRENLLKEEEWNLVARLGPGAFETISGHVVNVALPTITAGKAAAAHQMAGIDVSDAGKPAEKAQLLRGEGVNRPTEQMVSRRKQIVPGAEEFVPRAEELVPGAEELVPGREEFVPGKKEIVPEKKQIVPAADEIVSEKKQIVPAGNHPDQPPDEMLSPHDRTDRPAPGTAPGTAPAPGTITLVPQHEQLKNPDATVTFTATTATKPISSIASCDHGLKTADDGRFKIKFWETNECGSESKWQLAYEAPEGNASFDGATAAICFEDTGGSISDLPSATIAGREAWGKRGVLIARMSTLPVAIYDGAIFKHTTVALVPKRRSDATALWAFAQSGELKKTIRRFNQALAIDNGIVNRIPFDLAYWQKVAAEKYPDGLPEPESDDPTQWLFHGRPDEAAAGSELQVAVARLLGYRWPAESDDTMRLSRRARELVARCDELLEFADDDGIVCIPSVRREDPAADRLRRLLARAYGEQWSPAKVRELTGGVTLDQWLRETFFQEHCKTFHHRPFIWHIWDGRKDGFHALVNYHKLAASGGMGRKTLETLTYSYLGDWIKRQEDAVKSGEAGAEARLAAAMELKEELENILAGEPPYDLFIRWKPLHEQPLGWEPDINDGVRLNIRPFMSATLSKGKKGAGVLRFKPNIKWTKDRGKEPQKLRPREEFPWFWGWDEKTQDFTGGAKFDGNRWNDLHYTNAFKQAARERAMQEVS